MAPCAVLRGEPLWELRDVVRPLVNPNLATLLLLYAASLTDDLLAPVSCNFPLPILTHQVSLHSNGHPFFPRKSSGLTPA